MRIKHILSLIDLILPFNLAVDLFYHFLLFQPTQLLNVLKLHSAAQESLVRRVKDAPMAPLLLGVWLLVLLRELWWALRIDAGHKRVYNVFDLIVSMNFL